MGRESCCNEWRQRLIIIRFIEDEEVIEKILKHPGLREMKARPSPELKALPVGGRNCPGRTGDRWWPDRCPLHSSDWFVALDVALSGDTPESPPTSRHVRLGAGVVLSLGDFLESPKRGYFIHPGLKETVLEMSRSTKTPLQLQAIYGNSYADAAAASQEFSGIPCVSLGIPIRYSHMPSSLCHVSDMVSCLNLTETLIRRGVKKDELKFRR
jgi:hypothetical protein